MGCLRNIIRALFLTLAIVGFVSLGGNELVGNMLKNYFNPPQDVMLERAQKVGDFSKINDEFEIEKAAGIMGYNVVAAEHKASGQKMFVVDSGKKELITPEDIQSDNVEEKLQKALSKVKYQALSVDNLKVTKHGILYSYGTSIPYVKFEARVKKLPIGDVGGMVSAVKAQDGTQRLLISANEKEKYSQLISDEFFRKIK